MKRPRMATLGQGKKIIGLLEEVPSEQVQALLESGLLADLLSARVEKVDRNQFRRMCGLSLPSRFQVFKTIRLGTGPKTVDDFRKSLKDNGFKVGGWANDILGKPAFTVATEETEVDLVVISVAELGFKNGATRQQIYARAKELGLDICPAEVGPQLRLQYKDQPNSEGLVIGMEPIAHSDGDLRLFSVGSAADGRWLGGYYDRPGVVWDGRDHFVFFRPRK